MFETSPKFDSVQALFDAAESNSLSDSEFDDQLWLIFCDRVSEPKDLSKLPPATLTYYASRLLQWEVGNGGFAQAANNVPSWFSHASRAYDALGKPEFATLIRKAEALIPEDPDDLEEFESEFEELDETLSDVEWEIDAERIAFVKSNRSAFVSLDKS